MALLHDKAMPSLVSETFNNLAIRFARLCSTRRVVVIGIGTVFLALYGLTACPTIYWYDSAEYTTAAAVLGIAHPPGYPLYTLIGHLFISVLPVSPAYAMNLMSAVFGAVAVSLHAAVALALGLGPIAAILGASAFGLCSVFWSQATIAEVYTAGTTFLLLITLLLLRALHTKRNSYLLVAALLAGLSCGIHYGVLTCGLGWAYWSFLTLRSRGTAQQAKCVASCCLMLLLGAAIMLYVPWRGATNPPLNIARYFLGSWSDTLYYLTGATYESKFSAGYDLVARSTDIVRLYAEQFTWAGLVAVGIGMVVLLKQRPRLALGLCLIALGNSYAFFNYSVHDLEVFLIPSVAIGFLFAASAFDYASRRLPLVNRKPLRTIAMVSLASCLVVLLFQRNVTLANHRNFTAARDFGDRVASDLPPNALLFNFTTPAEWRLATVFSFYYQVVLARRPDIQSHRVNTGETTRVNIEKVLRSGADVFVYVPIKWVKQHFSVTPFGPVYRLSERNSRPTQ